MWESIVIDIAKGVGANITLERKAVTSAGNQAYKILEHLTFKFQIKEYSTFTVPSVSAT